MDPVETEALRRRLYAPNVTEEDRSRYAAVAPEARQVRTERRTRVPLALLVAAAVLVVAAGAAVTGRLARPDVSPPVATRAAASGPPTQPRATGTAERLLVSLDGVAAVAQRQRGEGQAVVPIDTTSASYAGGSVVVELSSTDGRPMGWEARRLVTREDWSSYQRVIATSPSVDRRGTADPVRTHYTGAPPLWIAVEAPTGATWTLTVALTRAKASALR